MKRLIIPLLFIFFNSDVNGQNDRVNDFNHTNWLQSVNTIRLSKDWSLHVEYQWRRSNGFKNWLQSQVRAGVNYKITDNVTVHAGYSWIETFVYGDFPIASNGRFPEHRIYEQLGLKQSLGKFDLSHRFRIEQRWSGRVKPGTQDDREIEGWTYANRFRYQFRVQHPIWKQKNKQLYVAGADEIFIAAGKNVGTNLFDQNRIYLLLGYKFNKNFSLEGGYFNQTLQQGRRINNNTIIQRNNGIVLTSILTISD